MSLPGPHKTCPKCQTPAALQDVLCAYCGHAYRTQFDPPPDQTQMVPDPPPARPPQAPPAAPYPPAYPPYAPYGQQPRYQVLPADAIQVAPGSHSVALAVLLAALVGGWAGMLVNRQYAKGITWLVGGVGFAVLTGCWAFLFLYPVGIIDSALIAQRLNRGEAVRPWQFF